MYSPPSHPCFLTVYHFSVASFLPQAIHSPTLNNLEEHPSPLQLHPFQFTHHSPLSHTHLNTIISPPHCRTNTSFLVDEEAEGEGGGREGVLKCASR